MKMIPMTDKCWDAMAAPPSTGTLKRAEPHPSAMIALRRISAMPASEVGLWQESFSSCAIDGNRMAEVCAETLQRLQHGKPVSDRYIMGLYIAMQQERKTCTGSI